jgi:hypothetical protein
MTTTPSADPPRGPFLLCAGLHAGRPVLLVAPADEG